MSNVYRNILSNTRFENALKMSEKKMLLNIFFKKPATFGRTTNHLCQGKKTFVEPVFREERENENSKKRSL